MTLSNHCVVCNVDIHWSDVASTCHDHSIFDQSCCCLQVREYLEKHYQELSGMDAVKMAIKALTETVEAGSKNMEVLTLQPKLPPMTCMTQHRQNRHVYRHCSGQQQEYGG